MQEPPNPLKNKRPENRAVTAVCRCEKQIKFVTWRNIKNKFPKCRCGKPMKVISDADTLVSTPN